MTRAALLIGVSQHGPGLKPLSAASGDVKAMQRILQAPEWGGFEVEYPLLDPEPTDMQISIEKVFSERDHDDLAVLFFSGYVLLDAQGRIYFSTRSTNKSIFRATSVPASFLQEAMNSSRCDQQVVILDCCFCDQTRRALARGDRTIDFEGQLGGDGRILLTTSTTATYSSEQKQADLSTYTRYFIEGMETGAASQSADSNGWISVQELHHYATRKTKITAPQADPQLIRQNNHLNPMLVKAQAVSPSLKYRRAAERYAYLGQFSPVDRSILETYRLQFGVSRSDAALIEKQILHPYRDRERAIQKYRDFIPTLQEKFPPEHMSDRLNDLQIFLGLGNEDVETINQDILKQLEAKQQTLNSQKRLENLQRYRRAFELTIQDHYPLTSADHDKLRDFQQTLDLSDDDVVPIQDELTSHLEAERAKRERTLKQYQAEFSRVTEAGLPIGDAARQELKKFQHALGLSDEDVRSIEQAKTQQNQAIAINYPANLRRYEQELLQAVIREFPISDVTQSRLKKFQHSLGLDDADVDAIQQRIFSEAEAEVESHQKKLNLYREHYQKAVKKELPLSESAQNYLNDIQRSLGLADSDVKPIQQEVINQVKAQEAEYQDRLNQYANELTRTVEREYPLSEAAQSRLAEFRKFLKLSEHDVQPIEGTAIAAFERGQDAAIHQHHDISESSTHSPASDEPSPPGSDDLPSTRQPDSQSPPPTQFAGISSPAFTTLYSDLQNQLERNLWRQADEKTFILMLQIVGRGEQWLSKAGLGNFPCGDLRELDRLWVEHSKGRFGFSVQRRIFESIPDGDPTEFGKRVGWWQSGLAFFKPYDFLNFGSDAPVGHLPAKWFWKISPDESCQSWGLGSGRGGTAKDTWMLKLMASKLAECGISIQDLG
ncbi:MAG: GUN4 domain-containing protein [Elainellaceae cyanobacterium]